MARLLAHENWIDRAVQDAKDQIARGEFLDEAEMDLGVERMLKG